MFMLRTYARSRKAQLLRDWPARAGGAAAVLGDDLKSLANRRATVYDSKGRILFDVLPWWRARQIRRRWNRDCGRLKPLPFQLVLLGIREVWR